MPTNVHDSDCTHAFSSPVGTVVLALFVMLYTLIPRVETNGSTHFPVFLMCSQWEVFSSHVQHLQDMMYAHSPCMPCAIAFRQALPRFTLSLKLEHGRQVVCGPCLGWPVSVLLLPSVPVCACRGSSTCCPACSWKARGCRCCAPNIGCSTLRDA